MSIRCVLPGAIGSRDLSSAQIWQYFSMPSGFGLFVNNWSDPAVAPAGSGCPGGVSSFLPALLRADPSLVWLAESQQRQARGIKHPGVDRQSSATLLIHHPASRLHTPPWLPPGCTPPRSPRDSTHPHIRWPRTILSNSLFQLCLRGSMIRAFPRGLRGCCPSTSRRMDNLYPCHTKSRVP